LEGAELARQDLQQTPLLPGVTPYLEVLLQLAAVLDIEAEVLLLNQMVAQVVVGGILAVLEEQALLGRQGRGITVAMLLIQALAAVVVRVLLALMELQMDVVMKHQPVMGVMELHLQFQEAL